MHGSPANFRRLSAPFFTCEPVLTEAFHLLRRLAGGHAALFSLMDSGLLVTPFSVVDERTELGRLMTLYRNVPMSLADACLVRLAELDPRCQVFTLDGDFNIYRRNGRQTIPLLAP